MPKSNSVHMLYASIIKDHVNVGPRSDFDDLIVTKATVMQSTNDIWRGNNTQL